MSKLKILAASLMLSPLMAVPAYAGEAVEGVGGSRSDAMNDANARARTESARRFAGNTGCITPARLDSCRQDQGDWICIAYVANHQGSCR